MSVINKMLRDLDARRGDARVPSLPQAVIPAAMDGTVSVAAPAARRIVRWIVFLVLLLLLAALTWYLHATQPVTPPPVVIVAPAPVVVPTEPTPEAVTNAAAPPPIETAVLTREPPAQSKTPVAAVPREKRRVSEAVVAEARPPVVSPPHPRAPVEAVAPASVPVPKPAAVPVAESTAPAVAQRRQTAAQEALAQAQVLWNGGSREAALELVRDTVVAVERAQPLDTGLLAQLVREQVRMEQALGRPAAVLAVLTRLESPLSGQADLWAVRGNAAQRLGRHQESVQAYLSALQLRPDEPRWMLGAAVSLAALGQLEAAARQAEQARALGPISPEVLAYLRQAGVPLR